MCIEGVSKSFHEGLWAHELIDLVVSWHDLSLLSISLDESCILYQSVFDVSNCVSFSGWQLCHQSPLASLYTHIVECRGHYLTRVGHLWQ